MSAQNSSGLRPLVTLARHDLINGMRRWDVFTRLGWLDIKRRYRRTMIGPLWGTLNLTVFIVAMGTVGGGLFNQNVADYLPFLAAGMIAWVLISSIITEACSLFIVGQSLVSQMKLDYSILVYALVWRNFITFLHNVGAFFVVVLIFVPSHLTLWTLLIIPGILILLLNGVWMTLLLGMVCLRFRDLQQAVATFMQIGLFITPVLWPPESLQGTTRRFIFVDCNPFHYLIEIIRAPLLGTFPNLQALLSAIVMLVAGSVLTYFVFDYFRKRIAYWA